MYEYCTYMRSFSDLHFATKSKNEFLRPKHSLCNARRILFNLKDKGCIVQ